MDIILAITIACNLFLLFLIFYRQAYLDFPFLTGLIAFNVISGCIMGFLWSHNPDLYALIYYRRVYLIYILWIAVVIESHAMRYSIISIPIELYAVIKLDLFILPQNDLVYWVNHAMRFYNLAVILLWIAIFWPKGEDYA
jgi:hypothetical protein